MNYLDLSRGEADLALRIRPPPDRSLTVVATARQPIRVWVSKEYRRRLPRHPSLADLDWISWAPPYDTLPPNPQLEALVPGFQPVFTSDSILIQWRAAEDGVGAVATASAHRISRASRMVPLALELGPQAVVQFHLVCSRRALELPRVKAVVEALVARMSALG